MFGKRRLYQSLGLCYFRKTGQFIHFQENVRHVVSQKFLQISLLSDYPIPSHESSLPLLIKNKIFVLPKRKIPSQYNLRENPLTLNKQKYYRKSFFSIPIKIEKLSSKSSLNFPH
jgi:hypothetical protein